VLKYLWFFEVLISREDIINSADVLIIARRQKYKPSNLQDNIGKGVEWKNVTNNSQSRAYTKRIDITDLNSPVSIIPKNGVVVVPLN
jgi:hypothetical protein